MRADGLSSKKKAKSYAPAVAGALWVMDCGFYWSIVFKINKMTRKIGIILEDKEAKHHGYNFNDYPGRIDLDFYLSKITV